MQAGMFKLMLKVVSIIVDSSDGINVKDLEVTEDCKLYYTSCLQVQTKIQLTMSKHATIKAVKTD